MPFTRFSLLFILFALFSNPIQAQQPDEIRYFNAKKKETTKKKAYYIKSYYFVHGNRNEGKIITTTAQGRLISDIDYLDFQKGKIHGVSLSYDTLGKLLAKEIYHDGKKNGPMESYYPNGQRRRYDLYENDSLISGRCFTSTGADTTYFTYREIPTFPGGDEKLLEFIAKNTQYPAVARNNLVQGIVIISFVITSTGEITEPQVYRSVNKMLDEEALRVVKLMAKNVRWKPGILEGEEVDVRYNLPFRFSLR